MILSRQFVRHAYSSLVDLEMINFSNEDTRNLKGYFVGFIGNNYFTNYEEKYSSSNYYSNYSRFSFRII